MAKCAECNSRKGKRECAAGKIPICSECCGIVRNPARCAECSYYSPSKRRYQDVPAFSTLQMQHDHDLQDISDIIEGTLCSYDIETGERINDTVPIAILERLIDKYHFGESVTAFENADIQSGFAMVENVIVSDLGSVDPVILVKVLSVLRFVARRRTTGRREYLSVIKQYVGVNLGRGMRVVGFDHNGGFEK